jgi:hypothetical protein
MDQPISTALISTERPPLTLDVKRALLTFDQVNMSAPEDREPIDPTLFSAVTNKGKWPPGLVMGGSTDPVLRLGKIAGYDEAFAQMLDECRAASDQGSLVVRTTVHTPGERIVLAGRVSPKIITRASNTMLLFWHLAARQDVLLAACRGLPGEGTLRTLDLATLAPGGAALGHAVDGAPSVADLNDGKVSAEIAAAVQKIAAARLGCMIKHLTLCDEAGFHPSSSDTGMVALLELFQSESVLTLASVLQDNAQAETIRRAVRVERVVLSESVSDTTLGKMSVAEVLRLRTKAWGRAGEARAAFFSAVRKLAEEHPDDSAFDRAVREVVDSYKRESAESRHELKKLVVDAAVAVGAGVLTGNLCQSLIGVPTWNAAAAIVAFAAAYKGKIGKMLDLVRSRNQSRTGPGKALLAPYAFALRE